MSFFFSSRRRHTRSNRDWSSDVCSSDLLMSTIFFGLFQDEKIVLINCFGENIARGVRRLLQAILEIGRASCRERGELAAVVVCVKVNQVEKAGRCFTDD